MPRPAHGRSRPFRAQGRAQAVTRPVTWPHPSTSILSDWDPAWDPFVDRARAATFALSGTGQTFTIANGIPCMNVTGSGGLLSSAPFAALDDVAGDRVTLYVVAEYTGAAVIGAASLVGIYDDSASANQVDSIASYVALVSNAIVASSADNTDPAEFDIAFLTRNTVQVYVIDISLTSVGMGINAAPAGPTTVAAPPHNPANLDMFVIGGAGVFVNSGQSPWLVLGWEGRIYRSLICAAAPDADILTYLQGLYL